VTGQETITPVVPDEDLRDLLDLDADEAVLRIERTSSVDGRVVECRITLLRGSRFRLVSSWPDGGAVTPRLTPPA
jgi:DNA-binding GntR family transcriptional regulator